MQSQPPMPVFQAVDSALREVDGIDSKVGHDDRERSLMRDDLVCIVALRMERFPWVRMNARVKSLVWLERIGQSVVRSFRQINADTVSRFDTDLFGNKEARQEDFASSRSPNPERSSFASLEAAQVEEVSALVEKTLGYIMQNIFYYHSYSHSPAANFCLITPIRSRILNSGRHLSQRSPVISGLWLSCV